MHHSLRFYRQHSSAFLRFYLLGAKLCRLPLLGAVVRAVANAYGFRSHTSYSLTLAEAQEVVELSPRIALGPCRCRQVSHNCQAPQRAEMIIGPGMEALPEPGEYEFIAPERAKALLEEWHQMGLFHTLMRYRGSFYALCNCCRCCCVPTRLKAEYGIQGARLNRAAPGLLQELRGQLGLPGQ